jgi:hypothetical protein
MIGTTSGFRTSAVATTVVRTRTSGLRRWGRLGITILAIAAVNIASVGTPTLTQRVLASLLLAIAAWVVGAWFRGATWASPFMGMFASLYVVYYAFPIFALENYTRAYYVRDGIADESIEWALFMALIGLVSSIAGIRFVSLKPVSCRVPTFQMVWNPAGARRFAVATGVCGLLLYGFLAGAEVPLILQQIVHYAIDLPLVAILILWVLQLRGDLRPATTMLLWLGLLPARLALGFGTGATAQGVEVPLAMVISYCIARTRVPWRALLVVAGMVILLLPARAEFRALTWKGDAATLSLATKALLYFDVVSGYVTTGDPAETLTVSISRLAHIMTFAEVVEKTPAAVPYWGGASYYALVFKLVPRILYPEKPTVETGQWFGHQYGFLDQTDTTTSYNLPQLIELYVNFGPLGVIAGMFVIGIVYGITTRLFIHDRAGIGASVTGSYVLARLLLIESSAALVFGGLVWNVIFLGGIHSLFRVVGVAGRKPR